MMQVIGLCSYKVLQLGQHAVNAARPCSKQNDSAAAARDRGVVGSSAEELPCSSQLHVPMQAMLGAPAASVVAPHQLLPSGSSSLQTQLAPGQAGTAASTPLLQSVLSSMQMPPALALGAAQPLAAPLTEQQCQQLLLWQSQQWQLHQLQQLCLLQSSAAQQHQAAQQQQLLFQQPGQQLATAVVADEGPSQREHQQQGQPHWEAAVAALQQHFQVPAAQQERFCQLCLRLRAVIEVHTLEELFNACIAQELPSHCLQLACTVWSRGCLELRAAFSIAAGTGGSQAESASKVHSGGLKLWAQHHV